MYMVPLRTVMVGPQLAVMATRIVAIMSTASHQARQTIKNQKRNKTLINGSGRNETRSVVFLDNGSVIASPFTVTMILNRIEKSNLKNEHFTKTRLQVYDVKDSDPMPQIYDELLKQQEEEYEERVEEETVASYNNDGKDFDDEDDEDNDEDNEDKQENEEV